LAVAVRGWRWFVDAGFGGWFGFDQLEESGQEAHCNLRVSRLE